MSIYILKLYFYDTDENVRYFASGRGFAAKATDTPDDFFAPPLLVNPGNYESFMFRQGSTVGISSSGVGEIILNNGSGELDAMINYGYSRAWELYRGPSEQSIFPDEFVLVSQGIVDGIEYTEDTIKLLAVDRQSAFRNLPLVTEVFSGDTSDTTTGGAGNHVNGTPDDWGGKTKPWVIQFCGGENFEPPMVNAAKQTFMVSTHRCWFLGEWPYDDILHIEVFMEGVQLTAGTEHSSIVDLQQATVVAGEFDYYLGDTYTGDSRYTGCYFRIGGAITGKVTCRAVGPRGAAGIDQLISDVHTCADAARAIFERAGVPFPYPTFSPLETSLYRLAKQETDFVGTPDPQAGLCVPAGADMKVGDALDKVLGSAGATWFDTTVNGYLVAQLREPTTTATDPLKKTFNRKQLLGSVPVEYLKADEPGNGLPCSKVVLSYDRNYTVMSESDAAGIVSADKPRMQRLKSQWKTVESYAGWLVPGLLSKFPSAKPFFLESYVRYPSSAQRECDRQTAMRQKFHDHIKITVDARDALANARIAIFLSGGNYAITTEAGGAPIELFDIVNLSYSRYGGSANYRVVGKVEDFDKDTVTFYLWKTRNAT